MSIGRRLIDLARAELNSLLDRAAEAGADDDDDRDTRRRGGGGVEDASQLSDKELAEEIERRRQAREEAEAAARGGRRATPPRSSSAPPPRRTAAGDDAIRKAYAALEIPAGSDFATVRQAYRKLMRKYHPDLHAGRPDKQRAATDVAQRLTEAYKTLDKHLRR